VVGVLFARWFEEAGASDGELDSEVDPALHVDLDRLLIILIIQSIHIIKLLLLVMQIEIDQQNSQKQVHQNQISHYIQDHKKGHRHIRIHQRNIIQHPVVIIHNVVPILANHDDKDRYEALKRLVEIGAWRKTLVLAQLNPC